MPGNLNENNQTNNVNPAPLDLPSEEYSFGNEPSTINLLDTLSRYGRNTFDAPVRINKDKLNAFIDNCNRLMQKLSQNLDILKRCNEEFYSYLPRNFNYIPPSIGEILSKYTNSYNQKYARYEELRNNVNMANSDDEFRSLLSTNNKYLNNNLQQLIEDAFIEQDGEYTKIVNNFNSDCNKMDEAIFQEAKKLCKDDRKNVKKIYTKLQKSRLNNQQTKEAINTYKAFYEKYSEVEKYFKECDTKKKLPPSYYLKEQFPKLLTNNYIFTVKLSEINNRLNARTNRNNNIHRLPQSSAINNTIAINNNPFARPYNASNSNTTVALSTPERISSLTNLNRSNSQ